MTTSSRPPLARAFPRLFSALGQIGCGATAPPDFRTPENFLAHLDRLGVTHSLVCHGAARDHDPARGNQRLIRELAACPAAQGRLFPALAVTPTLLWERDGVSALRSAMTDSGSRALFAFPAQLRYRIQQLDFLIQEVIDLNPFLLLDIRDVGESRDILELARAFPSLPIICTQGMWPHLPTIMDLMQRQENVLIETSWLHVGGILSDLVRNYGPRRVIFGLGPIAHQGAAIAGLAHAQLDEEVRHSIAYGNLAQLMGLPTTTGPSAAPVAGSGKAKSAAVAVSVAAANAASSADTAATGSKRLWADFLASRPSSLPIIDVHGHLGGIALWAVSEQDIGRQMATAIEQMDALGFSTMFVSGIDALFSDPAEHNLALADHMRPFGDRFRAYFAFNPHYAEHLPPLFERAFADPLFVGFKLLCDYWGVPVTDPRFNPVWEYANKHRLPILLHTWQGANNSPVMLTEITARHPEAIFLLGHSGGGDSGRREAEVLANTRPNVYLEWCGSFCCKIPWEETLARVNPQQVVFGTDGVLHDLYWELGRMLSLDVPDEILGPILGANISRVLSMRR